MSMERKISLRSETSEICVDYSGYSDASKEYKKVRKESSKKRFRYSSESKELNILKTIMQEAM